MNPALCTVLFCLLTSLTWPSSQKLKLPLLFLDSNTSCISPTAVSQILFCNLVQDLIENMEPIKPK